MLSVSEYLYFEPGGKSSGSLWTQRRISWGET